MENMYSGGVWNATALRLLLACLMAALGALIAAGFKKIPHKNLCLLISFAAGSLLAVAVLDIWPETAELVGTASALISFATGYLLFWAITRFVFHVCPACSASHTEINFKAITTAMLVALSVHSFMDGLAIFSGYAGESSIGIFVLIAVVFHKLPEGMALTLVGIASGMSRGKAFFLTLALESLTTIAGGLAGIYFLIPAESRWNGYVLGHAGGGFVFLVTHALFSEIFKHSPRNTILAMMAGALCIGAAGFFSGHF